MDKDPLKTIWMAVMLGILIATSPTWSSPEHNKKSNYDAPWVYPGLLPR